MDEWRPLPDELGKGATLFGQGSGSCWLALTGNAYTVPT